jgi:hypothetical protein
MFKILRYDSETHRVTSFDCIVNDSYTPQTKEIEQSDGTIQNVKEVVVPESTPRHVLENAIRVDPTNDPVKITTKSEAFPAEGVDRREVSGDTKEKIIEAREAGDTQAQIDHILDVLDVIDL